MSEYLYELKTSLITNTERHYLAAIEQSLPTGYYVQPQVNLASIITKNGNHRYQNELYRNIDACVFDITYKPVLLIEINDSTHMQRNRRERDKKIKNICEDAGIQLITFWTNYGVNQNYISQKVNEAIQRAPYYQRTAHFITNDNSEDNLSDNDKMIGELQLASNYNNMNDQNINNSINDKKTGKSSAKLTRFIIAAVAIIIWIITFIAWTKIYL